MGDLLLEAVNVPPDLPHKSRALELAELPSYVKVVGGGVSGTFTDKNDNLITVVNGLITALSAPTLVPAVIPVITDPGNIILTQGPTTWQLQLAATGAPTSWSADTLPAGVTLDGTTGLLSSPTGVTQPADGNAFYTVITATNATGSGTVNLTFYTVNG